MSKTIISPIQCVTTIRAVYKSLGSARPLKSVVVEILETSITELVWTGVAHPLPSTLQRRGGFLAEVYRCRRKSIALTDLRGTKQAPLDRWIYVKWRRRLRSFAKLCQALRHGVTHLLATLWWQLIRRLTLFVKRHVSSKLNNFPFRCIPYRVINPPSNYSYRIFHLVKSFFFQRG